MARERRSKKGAFVFLGMLMILAALVLFYFFSGGTLSSLFGGGESALRPISGVDPDADVAVHLIDVGQGDAVYIKAYDKNVLIDAGEKENGRTDVVKYLRGLGVRRLDWVIATHPHSDHIGGMQAVIESFEIGKIVMPRLPDELVPTTGLYRELLEAIAEKKLKITAAQGLGEAILSEEHGAKLDFLGPVADYPELNDNSVCVKFTAGDFSALFCGDAEKAAEKDLVASGADLKCNLLKLSHHGSSTSNTKAFLDAASPDCFLISVGRDNDYGHPTASVLKRLAGYEKPVFRTDLNGTIVLEPGENELKCVTER